MRLALVVQRYGEDVAGGAELHARYVAELLAVEHSVTVLTSNARDYITWMPHYPTGSTMDGGVAVRRFPVAHPRDELLFAAAAARAYTSGHSLDDERRYLEAQGPWVPELWEHLAREKAEFDALIAFSYRYVTAAETVRVMGSRTLLVPTAEEDEALGLASSAELFAAVGAIAFNSPEERDLIEKAVGRPLAGEVVGIGSRIPDQASPERFRARYGISGPYLAYVGRIDRNKGCADMFNLFRSFSAETGLPHQLVLLGKEFLAVPDHPRIRSLGFVSDEDKFDALTGAACLLMPSPYESLSMVTLEAMAVGVPPLVNGDCRVLKGQVQRSNAGLYYQGYEEFYEALYLLLTQPRLAQLLGTNGREYYAANYRIEIIRDKYERLLEGLPPR